MIARSGRRRIVLSQDTDTEDKTEALQIRCRQLQALYARAVKTGQQERLNVAGQIHDGVAQKLTALSLELSLLDKSLAHPESQCAQTGELRKRLRSLSGLVGITINSARKLTAQLYPKALEQFGLAAALESFAAEFEKQIKIPCGFVSEPKDIQIDLHQSLVMYRIAQEALLNTARHAEANRVEVRLSRQGNWLNLHIQDNGRGITDEELASLNSLGLAEMREQAALLGGTLKVNGISADGTSVVLSVPVRSDVTSPATVGNVC